MKPLKVVFFGTPDFAKASLEAIHHSPHEIVGVVTAPDKAKGRGQKIAFSPVKEYALEHNLHLMQPPRLKNKEFLAEISALDADVFVVVAFRMMPQVLFSQPPMGTFNLHGSLLPDYRGAAPINYALIRGEETTGVTTFFINEKIDEGNILLQSSLPIDKMDDAGTLHDKLMEIGKNLVVETLNGLSMGTLEEKPQEHKETPKEAFKIFKEDTRIDFSKDGKTVYNFIRGMSPYPAAFTEIQIQGERKGLKIFKSEFIEGNDSKFFISKTDLQFPVSDGFIRPLELQLEGKKRMPLKDFLNGIKNVDEITFDL